MATTSQIRAWWAAYRCTPSKMVRVTFPGDGKNWDLLVADKSKPIWEAVAQIMRSEPYLFLESAGGTYNCRPPSLHSYGLAIDINPSENPFKNPPTHNYPPTFIERMEGIKANGKQAIMWGGRFPADNPPDTMHWQINVAPADCKNVTWDQGDDMPLSDADIAKIQALIPSAAEIADRVWFELITHPISGDQRGAQALLADSVRYAYEAAKKPAGDGTAVPLKVTLEGIAKP